MSATDDFGNSLYDLYIARPDLQWKAAHFWIDGFGERMQSMLDDSFLRLAFLIQ